MGHFDDDLVVRPGLNQPRRAVEQHFRARDVRQDCPGSFRIIDFHVFPPLVGLLIDAQIGMLRRLQERAEPRTLDRHDIVQPRRLGVIGFDGRCHQREVARLDRHDRFLGATGSVGIRLRDAAIHDDRSALRAEGHPDVNPLILPAIDHGRHAPDFDAILAGVEIRKREGTLAALRIEPEMLAPDLQQGPDRRGRRSHLLGDRHVHREVSDRAFTTRRF